MRTGALLRRDEVRKVDMLLMPERAVALNDTGAAILALCNGERTVERVIEECRRGFENGFVAEHVVEFVAEFRDRGWLV